jgi:hypothetical protein
MSSITIKVEPLESPAERLAVEVREGGSGRVGLIAGPELVATDAPDLIEPVVGFRNWRIYDGGGLSSPHLPVPWPGRVLHAECRRFERVEHLLEEPHRAPNAACGCGISAYYSPTGDFSRVDFRGVSGIVTVWGTIDVDHDGMRAEHARVEALGLYLRWSRRQKDAVRGVATDLGIDLVDLDELRPAADRYGAPLPASLLADERPKGVRERFAALFHSRVGD